MDHIEWLPGNTGFALRDWTWTPIGRTQRGTDTIAILRLDELSDRAQSHVRRALLPSVEEILGHLSSGRIADALSRWKTLSNTIIDDPMAEWRSLSWCALHQLIPAARRIAAGLAMPGRP
ncbi:MAG: hypothetical protein IV100_34860 [Myxococcales bacterium]|nr:hypothetical protein [Myxococcales bacterium]